MTATQQTGSDPVDTTESEPEEPAIAPGESTADRGGRARLLLLIALTLVVVAVAAVVQLRPEPLPERVAATEAVTAEEFVAATGAEIVSIGESAGGGMIDIRYRVIDPDKALVFHDESLPIGLYLPGGVFLDQPFHEGSHSVELHQAVVYHELLVNRGSAFERGDSVTIVVGPYRLEGVPIQ